MGMADRRLRNDSSILVPIKAGTASELKIGIEKGLYERPCCSGQKDLVALRQWDSKAVVSQLYAVR